MGGLNSDVSGGVTVFTARLGPKFSATQNPGFKVEKKCDVLYDGPHEMVLLDHCFINKHSKCGWGGVARLSDAANMISE